MASINEYRTRDIKLSPRGGGLHPPPSVVSSWPAANHVSPETRGWSGSVVVIVFAVLTIAVYAARMWARLSVSKNAGLDDILMSIAMLPLLGLTIAVILGIQVYGFQWHTWDQTTVTLVTSRQITLAIEFNYIVSTCLIKVSILCFYRRMTSGSISKSFVYCVWTSIIFVILYCIAFVFALVFTCSPVEGFVRLFDLSWRLSNQVKCNNEGAIIVAVVVVSTLQDFIICALPIFLVWNLQISKRQKAALIGLFGVGLITCVCGIMRTYYAIYVYYYTYDITWIAFYGWVWTALEAQLSVICASAPALKVFFRRYFSISANRSGYGQSSRGMRAQAYARRTPGNSKVTSHIGSNMDRDEWGTAPVPLDRIKVCRDMNITVEDRDDASSQKSDASTRNLTALPSNKAPDTPTWIEGCRTVCAAFRPESRGKSSAGANQDIEMQEKGGP